MIIRATKKLLKISRIKPVDFENNSSQLLPGEWYANIIRTGYVGKLVVLFFHNYTKISIVCPTKSLNVAINQLPARVENYLIRHNFISLLDMFELGSEINIFSTNSRSTLAFMNQLMSNIEWHLSKAGSFDNIDYDKVEDIHSNFLYSIKGKSGKYESPLEILKQIKELK
jgi:hypothetical protein